MAESESAAFDCVLRVVKAQPLDELKSSIIAFLDFISANKEYKKRLCEQLLQAITEFGQPYLKPLPSQSKNVVFIPPEAAPVIMIPAYVPMSKDEDSIVNGLNKFVERCGEFSEPMEDIISETEMDSVLEAAHKKFGILDIIASFSPLKILSFHNSHYRCNCECGIPDKHKFQSVILVYHPRNVSVYDRFFIFAHEVGHALHIGLTGDADRVPDRFDAFNESLGIKDLAPHEKQESFADAVAIAILNSDGLREHLPDQLLKQLPPYFEKYVKFVTDDFFKKLHWQR